MKKILLLLLLVGVGKIAFIDAADRNNSGLAGTVQLSEQECCAVCLGVFLDSRESVVLHDGEPAHQLHRQCFIDYVMKFIVAHRDKTLLPTCPICRKIIPLDVLDFVKEDVVGGFKLLENQLFQAVKDNNIAEVHRLLAQGIPRNIRDQDGMPLLHYAVIGGFSEITELLLSGN